MDCDRDYDSREVQYRRKPMSQIIRDNNRVKQHQQKKMNVNIQDNMHSQCNKTENVMEINSQITKDVKGSQEVYMSNSTDQLSHDIVQQESLMVQIDNNKPPCGNSKANQSSRQPVMCMKNQNKAVSNRTEFPNAPDCEFSANVKLRTEGLVKEPSDFDNPSKQMDKAETFLRGCKNMSVASESVDIPNESSMGNASKDSSSATSPTDPEEIPPCILAAFNEFKETCDQFGNEIRDSIAKTESLNFNFKRRRQHNNNR